MPISYEASDLVDCFTCNLDAYKRGAYNEAQVSVECIDPLFVTLR